MTINSMYPNGLSARPQMVGGRSFQLRIYPSHDVLYPANASDRPHPQKEAPRDSGDTSRVYTGDQGGLAKAEIN